MCGMNIILQGYNTMRKYAKAGLLTRKYSNMYLFSENIVATDAVITFFPEDVYFLVCTSS